MGAYKRYREFGGKEQRVELRVREFCEFGTTSLRGITVLVKQCQVLRNLNCRENIKSIEVSINMQKKRNHSNVSFVASTYFSQQQTMNPQ